MKLRLLKWGYAIVWGLRLYLLWSRLYRWIWQRQYRRVPLASLSPEEAARKMRLLTWTQDGPREMWDAIGSPGWVQHCINSREMGMDQPAGSLDCDEFGTWGAAVVFRACTPQVLNVYWPGGGHHVCLFRDDGKWRHLGNWGLSPGYPSLKALLQAILHCAGDKPLVGWATFDPELRLRGVKWSTRLS